MRMWVLIHAMLSAVFCTAVLPTASYAWGRNGHELVGVIADKYLEPKARDAIKELLKDDQFKSLADAKLNNWADDIRRSAVYTKKFPKNGQWHYIDIDTTANLETLDLATCCENGDCILDAVKRFQKVLKDPGQPIQERRYALFFVAHFMGDMSQPLHCAERNKDKGGNLVKVRLPKDDPKNVMNLHKVWDVDIMLKAVGPLTVADYADRITTKLSPENRKGYQKGKLEDWIIEGTKLAREKVYKDKGVEIPIADSVYELSPEYMDKGAELAEEQLLKAGLRLRAITERYIRGVNKPLYPEGVA